MPRILFVCTANICRSPMAERLAGSLLAGRLGAAADQIGVASAGVIARDGESMEPAATAALRARGVDAGGFRARRLTAEQIAGSALVLVATREHRSAVVRLTPSALARSFTIREFDRYAAVVDRSVLTGVVDPSDRLVSLVEQVAALRGMLAPVPPAQDDIADPYRMGPLVMQACAEQIAGASLRWVDLLVSDGVLLQG